MPPTLPRPELLSIKLGGCGARSGPGRRGGGRGKRASRAVTLVAATSATAFADEALHATAPAAKTLGLDAIVVVPTGDYANLATLAAGALVRVEVPAGPGLVTARGGVLAHVMKDAVDAQVLFAPIYAGYRLPIGTGGVYVAGELGLTLIYASASSDVGSMSNSDSKLGGSLMGGLRKGALDLRAGLFLPDLGNTLGILASAGYDFAAF